MNDGAAVIGVDAGDGISITSDDTMTVYIISVCIDSYVIYQGFFPKFNCLIIVNCKLAIHTKLYAIHTPLVD